MRGDNISWMGISDLTLFGDKKEVSDCEIVNLSKAVKLYSEESYIDAATPHWEKMRVSVLNSGKKDIWHAIFEKAKGYAETAYKNSIGAQELEKLLDVGHDVFMADIPCAGAALERLEYKDWNDLFYNRALKIYNSGYWICGYKNGKFIICGEYE